MNWLEGIALLRLVGLIAILGWFVFGSTSYVAVEKLFSGNFSDENPS
jgi:hypothetical protein